MQLIKMDALQWLLNLSSEESPDVIFMDPMHPLREKKALVKKDLQLLQQMIGPDEDALKLLEVARMRAKKRVVFFFVVCALGQDRSHALPLNDWRW